MIDIHSHILPGIDDGASNLEESVLMAEAAVNEGIQTIIATPHHANGKYDNPGPSVIEMVRGFNAVLHERNIPLTVLAGQEIRMNRNLLEDLQLQQSICLHNTKYILLELPTGNVPSYTYEMMHELKVLGMTPIIAHPERNTELASFPEKLVQLIGMGALAQLTTHSINGGFGSKLQQISLHWCKAGLAHFISSDAHNLTHRSFGLKLAYTTISARLGSETVTRFITNAEKMIQNDDIPVLQPTLGGRKWWKFW